MTLSKPKITKKSPVADYKAKVKEDQSTVVAVYKGLVDVNGNYKSIGTVLILLNLKK